MSKEITKGDIITLNDKRKYLVLSKVIYENEVYLYLSSIDNDHILRVCMEKKINNEDISLIPIVDEKLIIKLKNYFKKDIRDLIGK